MISREELALLVSGAMHEACLAIEAVAGRRLTNSETVAMGAAFKTAALVISERSAPKVPAPPPAPGPKPPRAFRAMDTQEINAVTAEDIKKTLAGMSAEDLKKSRV